MHFLIDFMFASDAIDKFLVSVSTKIMIINREIGSGPRWERSVFFRISMGSYINYVNTFGGPKRPSMLYFGPTPLRNIVIILAFPLMKMIFYKINKNDKECNTKIMCQDTPSHVIL